MPEDTIRLGIVGCGPKALAVAAKAHVLQQQGLARFTIEIYDEVGVVGANWNGSNGYTDGEQPLGTPPEKDIGFPYSSIYGRPVNSALLQFSWLRHLVDTGRLGPYVDRGKPHPTHRQWSEYLQWVFDQLNVTLLPHKVININQKERALEVTYKDGRDRKLSYYHGVVLTGPGDALRLHESGHDWNEHILDGRVFWQRLPVFRGSGAKKVAIIGGGETAASIAVYLVQHAPDLEIELINRHGTIFTRGESFHENQLYTNPDDWAHLDEIDKEDFMRRTDRGVFSVKAKESIDQAPNVRVITGNVIDLQRKGNQVAMHVTRRKEKYTYFYDYVIVAIGFDVTSQLQMLADHLRPTMSLRDLRREVDHHLRIPLGAGEQRKIANLHVPNLAALTQGPGFPNLSCLGTLSDRILSAYVQADGMKQPVATE